MAGFFPQPQDAVELERADCTLRAQRRRHGGRGDVVVWRGRWQPGPQLVSSKTQAEVCLPFIKHLGKSDELFSIDLHAGSLRLLEHHWNGAGLSRAGFSVVDLGILPRAYQRCLKKTASTPNGGKLMTVPCAHSLSKFNHADLLRRGDSLNDTRRLHARLIPWSGQTSLRVPRDRAPVPPILPLCQI